MTPSPVIASRLSELFLKIRPQPLVGSALLALGLWLLFKLVSDYTKNKDKLPLPPQPPGNLILGNLSEVMQETQKCLQHFLMEKWARTYGEIYRVRVGPVTNYFLNSDHAVKVSVPVAPAERFPY
jgi:hypothetical protein